MLILYFKEDCICSTILQAHCAWCIYYFNWLLRTFLHVYFLDVQYFTVNNPPISEPVTSCGFTKILFWFPARWPACLHLSRCRIRRLPLFLFSQRYRFLFLSFFFSVRSVCLPFMVPRISYQQLTSYVPQLVFMRSPPRRWYKTLWDEKNGHSWLPVTNFCMANNKTNRERTIFFFFSSLLLSARFSKLRHQLVQCLDKLKLLNTLQISSLKEQSEQLRKKWKLSSLLLRRAATVAGTYLGAFRLPWWSLPAAHAREF